MITADETRLAEEKKYQGSCFCGAVQLSVSGEPAGMGYCHCESCRKWSAAPVNAFTLWKPAAVRITKGADMLGTFSKTPASRRKWCQACGGHVLTEHPGMGLIDVYAAVIPDFEYRPGVHVHYQETRLHLLDGLPKMKDLPAEMGGSGVTVAE
ncbi:MAG: GFA family protein [Ramlibacter sp.]